MPLPRFGRIDLTGVLEWTVVEKGLLLAVFLIPLFMQYMLWAAYVLQRDDRVWLTDVVYLESQLPVFLSFIGGALLLLALGVWLRRHCPHVLWYQHVCANYYALTLVYCGYMIGALSFTAGVVMVGAPLMGFILLERPVVYVSWLTALAAIVGLSYAGAVGLLQYAPAIVPPVPGDSANQLFWTTTTLFFAAPHIAILVMLGDFMLTRWREREMAFRTLSFTDPLTGVHNRRSILQQLDRELARAHRNGPPVSIVLLDLDHFKKINDTWGHPVGDLVLQRAATVVGECLRQSDALGRVGGEEFMLLLPDTDPEGAITIAERCRQRLADTALQNGKGGELRISASFGVSCSAKAQDGDAPMLVAAADQALYRAKQGGRNRVEVA